MAQWQSRDKSALIFCCLSPERQHQNLSVLHWKEKWSAQIFQQKLRFPTAHQLPYQGSKRTHFQTTKSSRKLCHNTSTLDTTKPAWPSNAKCNYTTHIPQNSQVMVSSFQECWNKSLISVATLQEQKVHFLFLHRCAVTKTLSAMLSLKKKTSERHP